MWPYWLLFLIPAYFALREPRPAPPGAPQRRRFSDTPHWWWLAVALALMIGLRHQVGGDWGNYIVNFEATAALPLQDALQDKDPGFRLLEWLAHQAGWGVHGVNLMGGALFSAGLLWFCRHLPRPWLALAVAVPYLVIPLAIRGAMDGGFSFTLHGTDYPTRDGTCVRDYIHVCDLADAHVRAAQHLAEGGESDVFNLGTGTGVTVREVAAAVQRLSGRPLPQTQGPHRPGDPPPWWPTPPRPGNTWAGAPPAHPSTPSSPTPGPGI